MVLFTCAAAGQRAVITTRVPRCTARPLPSRRAFQLHVSTLSGWPKQTTLTGPVLGTVQQPPCGISRQRSIATRSTLESNNSMAIAAATDDAAPALARCRGGSVASVVPEFDAQQLLRDMQFDTASGNELSASMGKLPGIRQQGILQHARQVAAHLRRLGIKQREFGSLFCRCPELFSWPAEERAGVLYSQLMRLGLSAGQAARCFEQQPGAATCPSFEPAIEVLSPLLAAGSKRRGRPGEQLLGDLLEGQPAAVLLLQRGAEALQHNIENLLQLGLSKQQVVAALQQTWALLKLTPERLARLEAVLQELGADRQLWVKVLGSVPRVAGCCEATLRRRAQALVAEFSKEEARRMIDVAPGLLAINTVVWRRALAVWQLCGVADPRMVAFSVPSLLGYDWLNPSRLVNLRALQQWLPWELSAAQVVERCGQYVASTAADRLAGRLLYLEQLGLLPLLVANKGAAKREWRLQEGLSGSKEAAGEPVFISVFDVANLTPTRFDSLVHSALSQQQQDDGGLVSSSSSSPSFQAFREGRLLQLPAWKQLLAQAAADVVELERKLPLALRRVLAEAEGGDGGGAE